MNELLSNPAVQTALVLVIVTGLNALVAWLKNKFPTQSARVEANWCYLQPVIIGAIAEAQNAVAKSSFNSSAAVAIATKALTEFADSYRLLEGKTATTAELESAHAEITSAIARVTGG